MRLIYHPEAEAELVAAARFYEGRVLTLGTDFLNAVDTAMEVITEDPHRYRIVGEDIRIYLLSKFPFAIYYRIHPGHLRILAFKHHSRHPDYWRNRLTD